ncbi:super-infection exclusion protein B [Pseudomonas sp. TUM22785]|uniref:super-infection exclusion protein B n=1 Tax=Pseudomonas sp. TUM22785 TaxID=3019098 RepID=UPI002306BEEB|nr:super-infection exclusion protein B [Pseudomonas sp. TUM22785]WCD81798.1 super-infection exclusion protein B [Pseudomonas sp. TUM22785]
MEKITELAEYFRKVPAAFLVAILSVLGLILFLPEGLAKAVAVDNFREEFRIYLGPAFLLVLSFCIARIFTFLMQDHKQKKANKELKDLLHNLTPEEKGYLIPYIIHKQNTVHVGMDDGVMAGLRSKRITYLAANVGDILDGFAFNLQPWARKYLEENQQLLDGYVGEPRTPRQRRGLTW